MKHLLSGLGLIALLLSIEAQACETPLPDDISVQPARSAIPPAQADFLGVWGDGKWDGNLCNTLIVEDIDEKGNARYIYAWDTFNGWNIWEGHTRGVGTFEGGKLKLVFGNGAIAHYWREGDGLKGVYERRGSKAYVTLRRKALP